jgi:putative hydrolase of the HAD superfamily
MCVVTRAVLFDYGMTLVTFSFPHDCLLVAAEEARPWLEAELGRPAPAAEWIVENILLPLEEELQSPGYDEVSWLDVYERGWRRAGYPASRELLYRILDLEQLCWDRAVEVHPEAEPALKGLRERGVRTGICSNAPFPPEMLRRQLRFNGLAPLLDAIVFSSEVGRRKPAPEIYQAALDAVGARAEEALFVGDKPEFDYDAPRSLGMRAVLFSGFRAVPEGYPAVDSLLQIVDLL